ncbi:dihydrodipicolinate synthase family protein [Halalkalibacter oceani]|uniref:dihydrodipicolinate synthase family protein n=1 Tax=Halalkalibacter oceani TaxID=1653776 RepID=UPI00339B217F
MVNQKLSFANGVIGATILPFKPDHEIDEVGLRKLIEYNLRAPKINGMVCNAFAGETTAITSEERSKVTKIVREQVDGRVPVIAGIWAESLDEVKAEITVAQEDGADAILLFPPFSFARGATLTPDIPVRFHEEVANESSLPIIAFQTRKGSGTCYTAETLAEISKIDKVIAIKNACFDLNKFEEDTDAILKAGHQAEILTGCDTILAGTMHLSDGALLGLVSLTPNFLSELMTKVKDGDLAGAYDLQQRYYELVRTIYASPAMDIPARMKQGLVELGIIETALVREPWNQLSEEEASRISAIIAKMGLKEL